MFVKTSIDIDYKIHICKMYFRVQKLCHYTRFCRVNQPSTDYCTKFCTVFYIAYNFTVI